MNTMQTILPLAITTLSALIGCSPEAQKEGDTGNSSDPIEQVESEGDDTGSPAEEQDTGIDDTGSEDEDTGSEIEDTGTEGDDTGDIEEASQTPAGPDDFLDLSLDAREDLIQEYTVDPTSGVTVEGEEGTTLHFWPNSLKYIDGTDVVGDVDVELIEVFDKGTMLVTDMPSMGRLPSGEMAQLISGGEHYVNVTQDDEDLKLATNFMLRAPVENTGGLDEEMGLFRAENADGDPAGRDEQGVWIEQDAELEGFGFDDRPAVADPVDPDGEGATGELGSWYNYWILSSAFGWTNIDRWYSDPRPKTSMHISVPDGWDSTNCAVYLSYDNEPTALARFDEYNEITELFSEHYGLLPIGLEVHVIFVTESEGQWSYAIQGQTIVEDHLTTFATADDFIETDMDGLVAVINALP